MLQNITNRIKRDNNLKDLLRYSGVMYASGLVSAFLITIQQITTARWIGPENYGRFAAIVGIGALAMLIADVRTWELGGKLLARPILDQDHVEISRITTWLLVVDVITGLLSGAIILLLAQPIATYLLRAPDLSGLVILYILAQPFRILANGIARTLIRMYNQYNWLSIKSIVYGFARLILISGAALIGLGLPGVILGAALAEVIGGVVVLGMGWAIHRREMPETAFIDFQKPRQFKEGLNMMRGLWLSATLSGLEIEVYIPLLALLTTPGQVGIFRSGLDIAETIEKLLVPFMLVLFPQVVKSYEQDSRAQFIRIVKQSALLMALLTLPFLFGIVVLGPFLLPRFLGESYGGVSAAASFLATGLMVYGVLMWTRPALIALNRVRELNLIAIAMIFLSTLSLLVGAPLYGAIGAAAIRGGALVLENALAYVVFRREIVRHKLPQELDASSAAV
jgi:O-antigen/teichoic acid export membrane protein